MYRKIKIMKNLKLYYSVQSGGDGSAYPRFSLSEELVEIDQEIESEFIREGWGESCTGFIELESESNIKIIAPEIENVITKESLIKGLQYYLNEGGYYKRDSVKEKAQDFVDKINEVKE